MNNLKKLYNVILDFLQKQDIEILKTNISEKVFNLFIKECKLFLKKNHLPSNDKQLFLFNFLDNKKYLNNFDCKDNDQLKLIELLNCSKSCKNCKLCQFRKKVVFGEGSIDAKIMLIGEGPGAEEDRTGKPFVGRSGQLLMKIINDVIKYKRNDFYITNIVKCRPPDNRNPEDIEANTCMKCFLNLQIKLIKPKVIVTLGSIALKYILNKDGITIHRGNWFDMDGIKVIPTFHPSYLLRNRNQIKLVESDFKEIERKIKNIF